jgi:hypothetical protein
MSASQITVYANVVNFRLTGHEFVLEFGAHFPDQPGPLPQGFTPEVRVVLPKAALEGMLRALTEAAKQYEEKTKKMSPAADDKKAMH